MNYILEYIFFQPACSSSLNNLEIDDYQAGVYKNCGYLVTLTFSYMYTIIY